MAKAKHFDVVVIGTGPGGEGAAMKCAKSGLRVAVIEQYNLVGGGCTRSAMGEANPGEGQLIAGKPASNGHDTSHHDFVIDRLVFH